MRTFTLVHRQVRDTLCTEVMALLCQCHIWVDNKEKEARMFGIFSCPDILHSSPYIYTLFVIRSRYFTAQSGRQYKWRITPHRMEVRLKFLGVPGEYAVVRSEKKILTIMISVHGWKNMSRCLGGPIIYRIRLRRADYTSALCSHAHYRNNDHADTQPHVSCAELAVTSLTSYHAIYVEPETRIDDVGNNFYLIEKLFNWMVYAVVVLTEYQMHCRYHHVLCCCGGAGSLQCLQYICHRSHFPRRMLLPPSFSTPCWSCSAPPSSRCCIAYLSHSYNNFKADRATPFPGPPTP